MLKNDHQHHTVLRNNPLQEVNNFFSKMTFPTIHGKKHICTAQQYSTLVIGSKAVKKCKLSLSQAATKKSLSYKKRKENNSHHSGYAN